MTAAHGRALDIRGLPLDLEKEPEFAAPWQAEAFACAVALSRRGLFTWAQWVDVFSAEVRAHPVQPNEAHDDAYHRQWLAALERIVRLKGGLSASELAERVERWRQAYLRTPHGEPVELTPARAVDAGQASGSHTQGLGTRATRTSGPRPSNRGLS